LFVQHLPHRADRGFYIAMLIGSWLHSRHFRISQTTNARGPFFVWRLVRATKRYRPSFFFKYISTFEDPELDISPSYVRSRTRLHPPCVRSARKNIMNGHASTHRSPGSSSIVPHNVHWPKIQNIQSLSPLLRPWRIPQVRIQTLSRLFRVSPRVSSPC
jgi:hypothetical protein